MLIIIIKISPYYLDYFNIIVGGTKTVYEKRLFQVGWWGQGIREAVYYVAQYATKGSRVALALSPMHVAPPLPGHRVEKYNKENTYDYVIVNFYNVLREGFDDNDIRRKYRPIHNVYADGAILVTVYKRK